MSAEFFDTAERALNQEGAGDTCWGNFGYWQKAQNYPQAAQALADLLADAGGLRAGQSVLDLGFGMGEQLRLWHQRYGVLQLLGLNPSVSQLMQAQARLPQTAHYRLLDAPAQALPQYAAGQHFDRILALDCAYHFAQREQLFAQLRQHIHADGVLAWTDLYLPDNAHNPTAQIGRRALCAVSRIPSANLHTLTQYQSVLKQHGWRLEKCRNLTPQVFEPFARWWWQYRKSHVVPRRARLKFDLTATAVSHAAQRQLLRYGLFVARPLDSGRQKTGTYGVV